MPIRDATKDEIRAMMARLREKREQRRLEADINEVIDMVQHRGPSQSAREGCQLPQGGSQGGRAEAAGRAFSWAAVAVIVARTVIDNWLFLLVLGFVVFGAVAVS